MPFRRRRPIARMATTAVVAGTAAHMGARSAQRGMADQADADPNAAAPADESAAPGAAAPEAGAPEAGAPEADVNTQIEQVKQLAALKDQGILTEEEFAAKKAQILGI
jgi:hypothetical protein